MNLGDLLILIEELSAATVAVEYRLEDTQAELVRMQRLLWTIRMQVIDAAAAQQHETEPRVTNDADD